MNKNEFLKENKKRKKEFIKKVSCTITLLWIAFIFLYFLSPNIKDIRILHGIKSIIFVPLIVLIGIFIIEIVKLGRVNQEIENVNFFIEFYLNHPIAAMSIMGLIFNVLYLNDLNSKFGIVNALCFFEKKELVMQKDHIIQFVIISIFFIVLERISHDSVKRSENSIFSVGLFVECIILGTLFFTIRFFLIGYIIGSGTIFKLLFDIHQSNISMILLINPINIMVLIFYPLLVLHMFRYRYEYMINLEELNNSIK